MDEFESNEFPESLSTDEVRRCIESFKEKVEDSSDSLAALQYDNCSWQPDLLTKEGSPVHFQRTLRLPRYAEKRIIASNKANNNPILAIPRMFLHVEELIRFITSQDILVSVIDEEWKCGIPTKALDVVSAEVTIPDALRKEVGLNALDLCLSADTNALKGKRLESLLSFLLSQVDDLQIHSTNLRTETEELDVVVRTRGVGRRSWQLPGASFMLVEAKNWSSKVGQSVISTFLIKIMRKRGTCRIGIIVGLSGFTSDAEMQEFGFSGNGDTTVCFVDKEKLKCWIEADDFDGVFERMIEAAMLR